MSHFPFVLQEAMGIAKTRDTSKRVANPTSATPATFELNWGYSENGPTDPQPVENAVTFMGPPTTVIAGKGKKWPEENVYPLITALKIVRSEGFVCMVPPDGYVDSDCSSGEEDAKESGGKDEKERRYLEDKYYEPLDVKKGQETILRMATANGWLVLRFLSEPGASLVDKLGEHFALARIEDKEDVITQDGDLTVIQRTGTGDAEGFRLGTHFSLKKGDKVIARSLCSYENGEMDNVGPTIELFETAAEWQGHGHGSTLMGEMESFFMDVFEDVPSVKFNVCYVTSASASRWFQELHGFQDWDGMGEELGKYLGE